MTATQGRAPGQWKLCVEMERNPPIVKRFIANYFCPKCGNEMTLMNHAIADDGTVSPSVVEPKDFMNPYPGKCPRPICGTFHENLKLEGWSEACKAALHPATKEGKA